MNGYKIVLLKAIFMLYKLLESERVCSGICKHVNITIQWITVVSTSDYLAYTLSLASHIVKLRKVVEVVKTVDAQHKPSSFSTSVFSP